MLADYMSCDWFDLTHRETDEAVLKGEYAKLYTRRETKIITVILGYPLLHGFIRRVEAKSSWVSSRNQPSQWIFWRVPKKWDKPMLRWKQSCSGSNILKTQFQKIAWFCMFQFPQLHWKLANFPNPPRAPSWNSHHVQKISYKDHQNITMKTPTLGLDDLNLYKLHPFLLPQIPGSKKLRLWIPAILIFDFMTPHKIAGRGAIATVEDWRRFLWNGLEINKIFGVWGHYM